VLSGTLLTVGPDLAYGARVAPRAKIQALSTRGVGVRHAISAFLFVTLLAAMPVARGDTARSARMQQNRLVVGALLDLTRGWTSLGRASRVTLRLAVADANAALARSGSPLRVRLRVTDARGEPAVALRELRRLAATGIRVVVGPQGSSQVAAVRRAAARLGVVVISQGSTAHSLGLAGDNVLRFVPDDLREGEAVVSLLRRDRIDAIVPVWRRDAGNAGLERSVRRQFAAAGGDVASGVPYATNTTTFDGVVASIARQAAALRSGGATRVGVYLAGFDEVVDLFRAARSDSTPWYGSDGVALSTRLVANKTAAMFAHSVGYPSPIVGLSDSLVRKARPLLVRARKQLGRDPDALALSAYDALRIAVEARERAGDSAGPSLRRALVGAANAHVGITGKMTLNRAGDRAYGNFDFWSVCPVQGKFEWRRTFEYAARSVGSGRILARARC
jgi:branched-chain amino acid transport system substrate-binding protein